MKRFKKILAVVLSAIMMLTALPVTTAFAEEVYQQLSLNTDLLTSIKGEDVILSFTPEKDGGYKFMSAGSVDTYATLYDSEWNKIGEGDDSADSNFHISAMLKAGNVYYLSVSKYQYSNGSFKVKVTEITGIVSATITKNPDDMTCIDGYTSSVSLKGLEMLFVTTDGKEYIWKYGERPVIGDFVIGYRETYVGEDGYLHVVVECGGIVNELLYELVENPVLSIEYHSENDIVVYENSDGYYVTEDKYIYRYSLPMDAYFVINYKDGTSVKCYEYENVNNINIYTYDGQYDNPWTVGTNYAYVTYMGVTAKIPVVVKGCEFVNVTVNRAPDREYILGDTTYGYTDERNKYEFEPTDIRGLKFTVEYADGTTRIFDNKDFDIEHQEIDGYSYSVNACTVSKTGTVTATINFMGAEISYKIKVVPSPIKSFEMTWFPTITDYEDRFEPVFDGAEFTITLKDGTQQVVTLSDENTSYGDGNWVDYTVTAGDYEIKIHEAIYENGELLYLFFCVDKWVEYEGVWFDESREIENIEVKEFHPDVDGMVLDVMYEDGSQETLTYQVVSRYDSSDKRFYGYAKTENGLAQFSVDKIYEGDMVVGCKIITLGQEFNVMGDFFKIGDVDGDSEISIMDVTAVQLNIAKYNEFNVRQVLCADTDYDGKITVLDATLIQLYLADLIEEF